MAVFDDPWEQRYIMYSDYQSQGMFHDTHRGLSDESEAWAYHGDSAMLKVSMIMF